MVLEESSKPAKKKLVQAQLPFCNQSVNANKRKLSSEILDDKQPCKIFCRINEKENVIEKIDPSNLNEMEISENELSNSEDDSSKEITEPLLSKLNKEDKEEQQVVDVKVEEVVLESESECTLKKLKEICVKNNENRCPVIHLKKVDVTIEKKDCLETYDDDDVDDDEFEADELSADESKISYDDLSKTESLNNTLEDDKCEDHSETINTPVSTSKRKLTPRTLERKKLQESIRLEKLQQKEREKEEKLKLKLEKEEQRRREKEEKERKRLAELKQKEDEKRLKEEERKRKEEAKEEEKRLKEEERRRKEEAREEEKRVKEEERKRKEEAKEEERKKKEEARLIEQRKEDQAKKAFTKFFILKKSKTEITDQVDLNQPNFMPFPVKPDMRLSPQYRRIISAEEKMKLDAHIKNNTEEVLYLNELKSEGYTPRKTEPTWPLSEEQHDVIIIESVVDDELVDGSPENKNKTKRHLIKAKLLQFHENRRPAYWGTWRKKSKTITSRRPYLKDGNLNYEVDSESEWEDEGEGEDIGDEEDSDVDEDVTESNENGYILDNTFVPHGYLSDEEVQPDEEIFDPEDQKIRLTVLKKEFDEEMKMKTERLKPRLLGCVWISNDTTAVSKGSLFEVLMKYRAVWDEENNDSIKVIGPEVEESPLTTSSKNKQPLPPNVMEQLVKFIHGNHLPFIVMVQEFRNLMEKENYPILSKRAISLKIKEIARKELDNNGKHLWAVNNELCNEYNLQPVTQLTSPNIEASKDTLLDNFLTRPSISPQKTKTSLTEKVPEPSILLAPSTPIPPPVKKRATLITLSHTPNNENSKTAIKVHKDTPRPLHPFFKTTHFKEPSKTVKKLLTDEIDLTQNEKISQ